MDVAMPDMDGFSALNAMKAQTRTRDVPVMLISASTNAQVRERSLQSGAMALVDRITPPSLLRSTVLNAMNA
jgi:CheY-like chemotaxis protein